MEDTYFRDLTKTRWVSLRQNELSDTKITSVIDSILVLIDEAKDRNYQRWPILGQYVWPNYDWQNNTYEDEVDYFETFLFNRLNWIDSHIPGNILQPWLSISAEANKIKMNLYGDYFSKPVLSNDNFKLNDAPAGMYIQNVEYHNASECVVTVSSDLTGFSDISVTVSPKIINTFKDLTSNKLSSAGFGDHVVVLPEINVFTTNDQIHIRSSQPESLPDHIDIRNITGQRLGTYAIYKITENSISLNLSSGIYFIVINTVVRPQIHRIAVMRR